jgi:hypothetical protein
MYNFHYGARVTGSESRHFDVWHSKNAIAKLVNFKILIAIYKKNYRVNQQELFRFGFSVT